MDKNLLKKVRFWSKFHNNITVLDAYRHLLKVPMRISERENMKHLTWMRNDIEHYLLTYCGFKRSRERREGHYVLVKNQPTVIEKRINRNYHDILRGMYLGKDEEDEFAI